jgi:hypothetical protein
MHDDLRRRIDLAAEVVPIRSEARGSLLTASVSLFG